MNQESLLIIVGSVIFTGIIFFLVIRNARNRPLTTIAEIVEDQKNPGLYHVFGSVNFMPDDSPSFEIYHHYLLNTADLKIIKGLKQRGSDFDINSPFAIRCLEHMNTISGRFLEFKKVQEDMSEEEEDNAEALKEKNEIRIIEHDRNESDTSIQKKITGNTIEVTDTSYGERNHFSLNISLDGLQFSIPKVKGINGITNAIWRKNEQKLFLFYHRMVFTKFGVGMLVLDTSSGNILSDDYFKSN